MFYKPDKTLLTIKQIEFIRKKEFTIIIINIKNIFIIYIVINELNNIGLIFRAEFLIMPANKVFISSFFIILILQMFFLIMV